LANTDVTTDTTIQDFLNNPNLFKKVDRVPALESVGNGIRFSNGDYTKSVETGEKSLDLVQNINPLVDEIGVSGNHSVGFGVDNLVTGRNCIVKERNNAVFGNGNISTAYEGFISGSENVLGFGDIISDYNTNDKFFKVQTKTFYDKCKSLIEDSNTPNELKEVYVTVYDTSMGYNTANFLHIKTHITKVGDNDEDQFVYVEDIVIPEGYGVYSAVSNIVLINLEGDFVVVPGAESGIIGHNNINYSQGNLIVGFNNISTSISENGHFIMGSGNILDNSKGYIFGSFNNVLYTMYNNNYILGDSNNTKDSKTFILGDDNEATSSTMYSIGYLNKTTNLNGKQFIIGMFNEVESDNVDYYYNIILGNNNDVFNSNCYILGKHNNSTSLNGIWLIGKYLNSSNDNQFILGSYNLETNRNFIIGSGTSDNRKNALEIDFITDELFANTSLETLRQSNNNVLTTKEYLLEKVQITRNDFDAEQDQTDFEIDGLYSYIEVLQNGLELRTNKYSISKDTDNNKTTISLNDGADENDWILIKSIK